MAERRWHDLKIESPYFQSVVDGIKTAEIRCNDRDFRVGDQLHLRECQSDVATGRCVDVIVTHVVHGPIHGIEQGYVLLSITRWCGMAVSR
jgi:hypothetical protein